MEKYTVYEEGDGSVCKYFVNLCRNVEFDQELINVRELLGQINIRARLHNIPLVLWDVQAGVENLAADQQPGKWKRGTRKIPEQPVAGF